MRLITREDFTDIHHKLKQRGINFLLSKFNIGIKRAESAFGNDNYECADCWIIPKVNERWNSLITGNKELDFTNYYINNYLHTQKNLKLLSLGSGSCRSELEIAQKSKNTEVFCVDISETNLKIAKTNAKSLGLENINFIHGDANTCELKENFYDVIYFRSSLHHFNKMFDFIKKIKTSLKKDGHVVIYEYVGSKRLQFPKKQITAINKALQIIPNKYKIRAKSNIPKGKYYGSGILRMIISDPSEGIDSSNILPAIHSNFKTIEEKPFGGNIIMSALKDISHHFLELNQEKDDILNQLFTFEDEYLKDNTSDLVFGVYKK